MTLNKLNLRQGVADLFNLIEITTIEELCEMTPQDLLKYKGIGRETIRDLDAQLGTLGFSLKAPSLNKKQANMRERVEAMEACLQRLEGKINVISKYLSSFSQ